MISAEHHFILATAGHVDHGKSALVRALTGTDPDRLPEEKARGITIDLGYAELRLKSSIAEHCTEYVVGMVDVPGHEDFVRNMVAGVGSVDAALLVVALDDGWMPQTEEHLQILSHLGVSNGVVALTKADLADDVEHSAASVRSRLQESPLAEAPIISTSATTGQGIEDLKSAICNVLSRLPPPRDIGKPRLPIDRAFILKGVGTVVTGTLSGGCLACGDEVVIQPHGCATRIRAMQNHGRETRTAVPGSRIALNLPDLHPRTGKGPGSTSQVGRGDTVLLARHAGQPTQKICARLIPSPRPPFTKDGSMRTPEIPDVVRVHLATAVVDARVQRIKPLCKSSQPTTAILTLASPLPAFVGDRFIVRDCSGRSTLAGGIVLDLEPASIKRRPAYRDAILAVSPFDPATYLPAYLARSPVLQRGAVLAESNFSSAQIEKALADSVTTGICVAADSMLVEKSFWEQTRSMITQRVAEHHHKHPEQSGLPLSEARSIIVDHARRNGLRKCGLELAQAICQSLEDCGIIQTRGVIYQASHRPALPPRLCQAGQAIQSRLGEHPFDPPSRQALAKGDLEQQALRFLIATGRAIELSADVVISSEAYATALKKIREHLALTGGATVSELRTLLNSNRRVTVPLLEHLDQERITRRDGDLRRLR